MIDRFIFKKHLEDGEEVLYSVHKHWIAIVKPSLEVGFFGLALPWSLYFIGFNSEIFFWVAVAWSVMGYLRFLYILVDWYSDAWLITDMSLVAMEWHGIFSNNSARISYDDVEGAAYEIKGFLGTVLRFGNMQIRVMSGSHLNLKNVANPKKAELALLRFQEKYMNEKNMQDSDNLKALLSSMVAHQNRMN